MGYLTTELAALAAGVQTDTIRDWKRRGILAPSPKGSPRYPLYAVADVRAAVTAPKPRRVTESSRGDSVAA